jgi:hypothetical protein
MAQEFQMERYDPLESPPPEEWLDMDEAERLGLVEDYHRRALYRARSFPSPCRRLAPILLISSFAIAWGGLERDTLWRPGVVHHAPEAMLFSAYGFFTKSALMVRPCRSGPPAG